MYLLLRMGDIEEFNRRKAAGEVCDLTACDLSRLDLRNLDASGLDLRSTNLEGASFAQAFVSGCYLPREISPLEMTMALEHGTRVRYLD